MGRFGRRVKGEGGSRRRGNRSNRGDRDDFGPRRGGGGGGRPGGGNPYARGRRGGGGGEPSKREWLREQFQDMGVLGGLDAMVGEEPVLNAVLQALTGEGDVADARESLALLRWADKQERARQRAAVAAEREDGGAAKFLFDAIGTDDVTRAASQATFGTLDLKNLKSKLRFGNLSGADQPIYEYTGETHVDFGVELPPEIFIKVSGAWRTISEDNDVWSSACRRRWPYNKQLGKGRRRVVWKRLYRETFDALRIHPWRPLRGEALPTGEEHETSLYEASCLVHKLSSDAEDQEVGAAGGALAWVPCGPSVVRINALLGEDGASLERARILVRSIGKAIVNVRIYPNTKLVLESPKRVFVTAIDADQLPVTVLITLHDARAFLETVTEIQHRLTAAEAP